MAERKDTKVSAIPDESIILKYSGIFDLSGLYKAIADWFIDYGFYLEEPVWKHKIPTPGGAEQEIGFDGWKKINEYVRYWVDLYIHMYDLVDVDVVKEGVKKKMNRAQIVMEFRAQVETDYSKRFETKFEMFIKDFMDKYLYKKDMDVIWTDQLYYITYKLHTKIKEFLGMETAPDPFKEVW